MSFNSLLIANRGEIACRIIRSAHEMGIRCIAVYVDADMDAPFVKEADESIRLPDGGYLDVGLVIEAAKKSGAQAIHPGYGFLSENATFARKVIKEGLIWVGPSPHVISVMGDKLKAKELAILPLLVKKILKIYSLGSIPFLVQFSKYLSSSSPINFSPKLKRILLI